MKKAKFMTLSLAAVATALVSCTGNTTTTQAPAADVNFTDSAWFHPETYVCYKAAAPITVDGNMTSAEWDNIPWTNDFVDIEGDIQPKPKYRTRAKMAWDEKGMYFAAEMEEPHVWGTLTKRESVIYHDNDFEIFIDPTADTHNYLEFEMNALGTEWDLFLQQPYRDQGNFYMNGWNFMDMQSAVKVYGTLNNPNDTDQKWTVEVFFSWESINETRKGNPLPINGEQMRVNFSRVQWNHTIENGKYVKAPRPGKEGINEDNWVWSPTGEVNMHCPEKWGFVQLTDVVAGKGDVTFNLNSQEEIKWKLRRMYYRQSQYKKATGNYATTLAELKASEIFPANELANVSLQNTSSMYEVTYNGGANNVWHIRQDGLIWK
ncbi:MAG: carbohydrate-binding family 9-like protein [Tannerellaceae bacterium]|nr:hypothetical protein [Porphyromonadaceae bacterium]